MLTNNDGTRYCLESVEEIIRERCAAQDFPYLTDVLGSDWGVAFGWAVPTPEGYLANALRAAYAGEDLSAPVEWDAVLELPTGEEVVLGHFSSGPVDPPQGYLYHSVEAFEADRADEMPF